MSYLRRIATLTAVGLASAGLVGVSTQPATAAEDPTLSWSFSDYLFNPNRLPVGFTSHATGAGATETAAGIVFGGGETTGSLASGDLRVAYDGSVDFSWHATIGFSNPEVVVDGGEGRIVADVSWATPETGSVNDVVLTTFDPATASVDGGAFTATPDWSTGSWAPELIATIPSSVQAFFRATGSSSDARKAPSAFTAGAEQAGPAVTATSSYARNAVTIAVSGSDFNPVVNPPREDGVYVALAQAGEFPETDDFEDQEKVADTVWVPQAQMIDGSFAVTLDPKRKHLDPRRSYSVYTWQAHAHSNAASDTETRVAIDFSKVGKATKLKAAKKGKRLVVTVGKGAAGKVAVRLTKGKVKRNAAAQVKAGKARMKLPPAKGKWRAVVTFKPSKATYRAAKRTVTVRVR